MATNWSNLAGGDWTTATDWSTGFVPASGTAAVIGLNGNTFTVSLGTVSTEADVAASLNITNATATVELLRGSTLTLGTTAGGFLSNAGTLNVGTDGLGAYVKMGGQFTNTGHANFGSTGNTVAGTSSVGVLVNSGTMTLAGSGSFHETVNVTNNASNTGTLNIGANSSLGLGSNKTFTQSGASAKTTVDAAGALSATNVTVNSGTFTDSAAFSLSNTGTITVNGGSASFGNLTNLSSGTLTGGTIKVAGGTLSLPGTVSTLGNGVTATTLIMTGTAAGASQIESNLTSVAAAAKLNVYGGHNFNGGTNTLTVTGSLNIDHLSTLTEAGLVVNGTVTDNGTIAAPVTDSGTLILAAGATTGALSGGGIVDLKAGVGIGTFTSVGSLALEKILSGTWVVKATAGSLATSMIGGGATSTLQFTAPGTFSLAGVTKFGTIGLADGTNQVTLTNSTLAAAVTLNGGSGPDTIIATGNAGQNLTFVAGAASTGDTFTGGAENDTVKGVTSALTGDSLIGGAGTNTITLTGAAGGPVDLSNASQFQTINMGAGTVGTSVTLGTGNFVTGSTVNNVTVNGSTTATAVHDSVISNAAGTLAAKGTLTYVMGAKTTLNTFAGGDEIDVVRGAATAVTTDILTGGTNFGKNSLTLTSDGGVDLSSVSNFGHITLSGVGASPNNVTVTNTTLTGTNDGGTPVAVTISDANVAATVNASTGASGQELIFVAGTGVDSFTGGGERDILSVRATAVGDDSLDGGASGDLNTLNLTTAGTFSLAGVTNFDFINLAGGTNKVTGIGTTTFHNATLTIGGGNGTNTITSGDTVSTDTLTYSAGANGSFTGDAEIDIVKITAANASGATLNGGPTGGANELDVTSVGTFSLSKDSNFSTLKLTKGTNNVTATAAMLSGVTVTTTTGTATNNITLNIAGVGVSPIGPVDLSNAAKISTINLLAPGGATLTLSDTTLAGNGNGKLAINDATGVGSPNTITSTGTVTSNTLTWNAVQSGDSFTGGGEIDIVKVSGVTLNLNTDTLTGGTNANNTLEITTAGSFSLPLAGVSNFSTIALLVGGNNVTVDVGLSDPYVGGALTISDSGHGDNVVQGGTNASGNTLTYAATGRSDFFQGGNENDTVNVAAANVGTDILIGGSGTNAFNITSAGFSNLSGVRHFDAINLAAGANTVDVSTGTLFAGPVTIIASGGIGAAGTTNIISAAGASGESLTYAASGAAGAKTTFFAGAENDTFTFEHFAGTGLETIGGFDASHDSLALSVGGGFNNSGLLTGPTKTFNGSHDYFYNTSNGQLFYSSTGSGAGTEIAVLTNHAVPTGLAFVA